jgi:hypothetical protein
VIIADRLLDVQYIPIGWPVYWDLIDEGQDKRTLARLSGLIASGYSSRKTPIVAIDLSTSSGHAVTDNFVRRNPKAWPP